MRHLATVILLSAFLCSEAQQSNPYCFVFLNKKPDAEKITDEERDRIMTGHMANINKLAEEGRLIAAGPFEGGGGIFVLKTSSVDEAAQWIGTDPGVQAKRWDIEILPSTVRTGGICKADEPFEMVFYNFIRFVPVVSKFNASNYPDLNQKHDDHLKKIAEGGSIIAEGTFGPRDGGIAVTRPDVQPDIFQNDAAVVEGLMQVEVKKLYIARGSFCEK